jgi:hypothetical protein
MMKFPPFIGLPVYVINGDFYTTKSLTTTIQ